jgi:hypothetical protein
MILTLNKFKDTKIKSDVGLAHPHECRNHEGYDCSSIKELHELGLIRRETVWFLSSRGN